MISARLEQLGYVNRKRDPNDSRSNLVTLTSKGMEMKKFIKSKLTYWTQTISEGLTDEETEEMVKKIKHMSRNALIETNRNDSIKD